MSPNEPFLKDPAGHEHLLNGEQVMIGRAIENDIVISSKRVSREHARIFRQGWKLMLEDMESRNGTFLNGERLSETTQLREADQIKIGDVVFTFYDPENTHQDADIPLLEVDSIAVVARLDRQSIKLSPKEFSLLDYLYQRRGEVCSKDEIGAEVWAEYQDGVFDYQIENLVRRLRTKLESNPADPQMLLTVRGRGYKLMTR